MTFGSKKKVERRLPFPKLLPEAEPVSAAWDCGLLVKMPSLHGKTGFTLYQIPPSVFTVFFKALKGSICPMSSHSTPLFHRQTEGGKMKKCTTKGIRGGKSTLFFYYY